MRARRLHLSFLLLHRSHHPQQHIPGSHLPSKQQYFGWNMPSTWQQERAVWLVNMEDCLSIVSLKAEIYFSRFGI